MKLIVLVSAHDLGDKQLEFSGLCFSRCESLNIFDQGFKLNLTRVLQVSSG